MEEVEGGQEGRAVVEGREGRGGPKGAFPLTTVPLQCEAEGLRATAARHAGGGAGRRHQPGRIDFTSSRPLLFFSSERFSASRLGV